MSTVKKILPVILSFLFLFSACGPAASKEAESSPVILATTYPVYLFTSAVLGNDSDYDLVLMLDQTISCLHDYTLSVNDMKLIERADVIVMNGAGLEDTMEDVIASAGDTPLIDCSQGIDLLPCRDRHHDGEEERSHQDEWDPHIWMDPSLACRMIDTIAQKLAEIDSEHAARYVSNASLATEAIQTACSEWKAQLSDLSCREMITFHDGFSYFARAFDLTVLSSIEEESGSEASAQEVKEIMEEIRSHSLPAIFTEKNGATATADMIARECGVSVYSLDLLMSREHGAAGIDPYLTVISNNVAAVQEAFS